MTCENTHLSPFELDAVKKILERDAPDLECQLSGLRVKCREHTGVGEYVYFTHQVTIPVANGDNRTLGKRAFVEVKGLKHGAGLILYVDNGIITMLEIFSHAGEQLPGEIEGAVTRANAIS